MGYVVTSVAYPGVPGSPFAAGPPIVPAVAQQNLEAQMLVTLKRALQAVGWHVVGSGAWTFPFGHPTYVQASGDGVDDARGGTFDATIDPVPAANVGYTVFPNTMGCIDSHNGAGPYFNIQQPPISFGQPGYPGGRVFTFHRALSGVSPAGFVGYSRYDHGATGAALVPSGPFGTHVGSAGFVILGKNDFTPTERWTQYVIAEDQPPWSWWNVVWLSTGPSINWVPAAKLFYEYVSGVPGLDGVDPEPYIISGLGGVTNSFAFPTLGLDSVGSASSGAFTWYGAGTGNDAFAEVSACPWGCQFFGGGGPVARLGSPRVTGANFWNGNQEAAVVFWSGDTQRPGLRHPKGWGHTAYWAGNAAGAFSPSFDPSLRYVIVGDLLLPWDGAATPFP